MPASPYSLGAVDYKDEYTSRNMPYHIISCYILSCFNISYYIISCHVMSCHVVLRYVTQHHIISISYNILHHIYIIVYCIISHYVILSTFIQNFGAYKLQTQFSSAFSWKKFIWTLVLRHLSVKTSLVVQQLVRHFSLTTNKTSKVRITDPLREVTAGFSSQGHRWISFTKVQ